KLRLHGHALPSRYVITLQLHSEPTARASGEGRPPPTITISVQDVLRLDLDTVLYPPLAASLYEDNLQPGRGPSIDRLIGCDQHRNGPLGADFVEFCPSNAQHGLSLFGAAAQITHREGRQCKCT